MRDEISKTKTSVEIDAELLRHAAPDPLAPVGRISRTDPPRWEVLTVVLVPQADLSRYLADGWQPISIIERGFNECIYYFKRPKA